ncbi:MAG: DNA-3-methyladenine glycosylase family protein [Candidatus Geothermincolia bacterium]
MAVRKTAVHHLTLKPVPPFDFDLSATIFSRGDPQFRNYEDDTFRQAIRVNGTPAIVRIRSAGTVEAPVVKVEIRAGRGLTRSELETARRLIARMFNLDMDLKPFYRAARADPVMSRFVKTLCGLKSPTTPTVFEALVDSIIEQQISLIAAQAMQNRLIRKFGEKVELDGETCFLFPTPERLAAAGIAELKSCGLSGRKAEYIKSIAAMVASGELDLDKFEGYKDIGEIRDELTSIRGIGNWTAEMTMIRGLHKMDSFPADDIGLQAKMTHYYGKQGRATSDDLRRIAENWGEYRGLGGYYMIMAHHVGVEPAGSWPEFWSEAPWTGGNKNTQGSGATSRRKPDRKANKAAGG